MVKGEDEEEEEEKKNEKEEEEERMISADDFEGRLAKTLLETCAGMVSSLKADGTGEFAFILNAAYSFGDRFSICE